jgi:hypothetical protein
MSDSYLLDAGWMFFLVWGMVVLYVSWAAFGHDLFPVSSRAGSAAKPVPLPKKSISGRS